MIINETARLSIYDVSWFWEQKIQATDDSSAKALAMYNNNSYVKSQRPIQKWFLTTLKVASHGITNNMDLSIPEDIYIWAMMDVNAYIVLSLKTGLPSSDCLDLDHNLLTEFHTTWPCSKISQQQPLDSFIS